MKPFSRIKHYSSDERAGGDPASLILDVDENDRLDLVNMGSRRLNKFQD
jgi:hypothetical protein